MTPEKSFTSLSLTSAIRGTQKCNTHIKVVKQIRRETVPGNVGCSQAARYPDKLLTNAMLFHEGDEVGFSEQLGWAGLPVHHLHSAGLKAGASLIDREGLQRAARASVRSSCRGTQTKDNFCWSSSISRH